MRGRGRISAEVSILLKNCALVSPFDEDHSQQHGKQKGLWYGEKPANQPLHVPIVLVPKGTLERMAGSRHADLRFPHTAGEAKNFSEYQPVFREIFLYQSMHPLRCLCGQLCFHALLAVMMRKNGGHNNAPAG